MMRATPLFILPLLLIPASLRAQGEVLVEAGSAMIYLANGSPPGIVGVEWTAEQGFDVQGWLPGTYGVGYEQSGSGGANDLIQTDVPVGTASIYTRAIFHIDDASAVISLSLGADWDDAYAAWINGVEVYRSPQMPREEVPEWNTLVTLHESSNGVSPNYGPLHNITDAGVPALHDGDNLLAVGVWNAPLPSSDLVVVPQLVMNLPLPPPRGPYLQKGTDSEILLRWRTDTLTDSRVQYGTDPGSLIFLLDDPTPVTKHEIPLAGLDPDTIYYYSVGSSTELFAGGDADHFFRTAPVPGSRRPIRIWAIGDSGTANANARAVRDAYQAFAVGTHTDLWLMLGDNAYPIGSDDQYQAAVFETFPEMLRKSVLWPTFGNHDGVSASSASELGPYYEIFNLPTTLAEMPVPSGTEAYYSFDFGNIHFVCLNSFDVDRSPPPAGAMLQWLQLDLMDTAQDWVIAFWHHPPYSKGVHDSDSEIELQEMRANALPILENLGVDLVLTGHSHSYERSFLLDGHYGLSSTLTEAMKPAGDDDGRVDGDGAYQKGTPGPAPHEGAVYVVAGSSGLISGGTLDHPAMFISWNELGSMVLDVEGDRLEARFLDAGGSFLDHFTMVKNTGVSPQADFTASPLAGPAPLTVQFTDASSTNTAAWDWDLDGDTISDSLVRNPEDTYTVPGIYTVELTASNAAGAMVETKPAFICVSEGIPAAVPNLAVAADAETISWDAVVAAGYDVVQGDLNLLTSTAGDFTASLLACLEDGGSDLSASDPALPSPGSGVFYLVRGTSLCDEPGTYESGGAGQNGSRDAEIQGSSAACP
jgi:hypothetical protein